VLRGNGNLVWLIALGACALAGCKPMSVPQRVTSTNDIDCFPAEARPWIAVDEQSQGEATRTNGQVSLYVDHSGSMAGYLRAETGDIQPFRDLIATVPTAMGGNTGAIRRFLFGKTLRETSAAAADDLLKEATYSCPDHGPTCDNQESRLDLALGAIAAEGKQNLSFLLSDLWLDNTEIKTSGAVALAGPLKQILASGRSIAIYGVPAPYSGRVYDLPSGKAVTISAKRPLFLLAVGPLDRLTQFDRQLPRSPSAYIATGVQSGAIKHSLFTLTPDGGAVRDAMPFAIDNAGTGISPSVVMNARRGIEIERLAVQPLGGEAAIGPAIPDTRLPHWTGPKENGVLAGAVWRGPVKTTTLVWKLKHDDQGRCTAADWIPWGTFTSGWRVAPGADQATFILRPDELSVGLGQSGAYLIAGQVIRVSLDTPNPSDQWMRSWSFAAEDEARIDANPPVLFPTLNLSETARLLENVLATSAENSPTVVGGFAVAIKLNR
jgi:hypothetical protein